MPSPRDAYTEQHLLKLLEQLYGPLSPDKRPHYLDACSKFTDTELRETFTWLRDNYEYSKFPAIADLQKARKIVTAPRQQHSNPGYDSERGLQPWEERNERRLEAVESYMRSWREGALYTKAMAEGWSGPLERYVREVAWVQIQIIIPSGSGIGYNHVDVFGISAGTQQGFKRRCQEFMRECFQQGASGRIEVTVPEVTIAEWQKTSVRASNAEYGHVYAAPSPLNSQATQEQQKQEKPAWEVQAPNLTKKISSPITDVLNSLADDAMLAAGAQQEYVVF